MVECSCAKERINKSGPYTLFFLFLVLLERITQGESRFHHFVFGVKSKELGVRVSPRLPCLTPVVESFSSDLLQAITSYWGEIYLEPCRISTMQLFCKNSQQLQDINYIWKKAPSKMFNWVLNTPLIGKVLYIGCYLQPVAGTQGST